jgi:regulator of protease activity HflC (stomatin/prohibitin superfamily)
MSDHQLLPAQPRGRGSPTVSKRTLAIIIAIAVVGAFAASAFVIVNPTEMAGKRRLGRVVVDQPLGPGLHLKLPLIEEIDKLQTSLET